MRAFSILLPPLLVAACTNTPQGTLQLNTGGETDTFTRAPAPTTLRVDAVDSSGHVTTLASAHLPTSTVDLGTQDENASAILEVSGLDDTGKRLVYGATVPVQYGALESINLPVFVQRTGELARMPSPLSDSRPAPALAQVQGQYLFVGGGSDSAIALSTQLYDCEALSPLASPPTVTRAPESVAFVGTVALLIDSQGGTYFDFSANAYQDVTPPTGATFADVAGGQTIVSDTGTEYIVGATRTTGAPTAAVLVINPSDTSVSADVTGKLSWATLSAPRLGAGATWVTGRGLVVTGGSAMAQGVEILGPLPATKGSPLAYGADPSVGAGATGFPPSDDAQHVLVAGGLGPTGRDAGVRLIDLACTAMCTPTVWSSLPVAIGNAQAFAWNPTEGLVLGSEGPGGTGTTHVFHLTSTAATEVPTKVPHTNARAAVSPLGSIVVVGGASEIESFYPQ